MIWCVICAAVVIFVGFGVLYICEKRESGKVDEVCIGGMIGSAFIAITLILSQVTK